MPNKLAFWNTVCLCWFWMHTQICMYNLPKGKKLSKANLQSLILINIKRCFIRSHAWFIMHYVLLKRKVFFEWHSVGAEIASRIANTFSEVPAEQFCDAFKTMSHGGQQGYIKLSPVRKAVAACIIERCEDLSHSLANTVWHHRLQ